MVAWERMGERRRRSIVKGLTWRLFATVETVILAFFFTGNISVAVSIGGLEVLTKTLWYYFHERLWLHVFVPHRLPAHVARYFEHGGQGRSILKAISWRFFGALDTFLISLLVTGHLAVSGSIGGAELVTKILLYYLHERLWVHVRWGTSIVHTTGVEPIGGLHFSDAVNVVRHYYSTGLSMTYGLLIILFLFSFATAAHVFRSTTLTVSPVSASITHMRLSSDAFKDGGSIPAAYTCDAAVPISPPLSFSGVPAGAKSLALIVEDFDVPKELLPSGTFDHWVLMNIDPAAAGIPEGSAAGLAGKNSAGESTYTAPCPPPAYQPAEHRYQFTLYALNEELPLSGGASKEEVLNAMRTHILAEAELIGRYERVR